MKRSLTGIKPTGQPHLGNYLGMIRPAINLQKNHESFYFVADYHALTTNPDPQKLRQDSFDMAAAFLAFGLDPTQGAFFKQSDIPQVAELQWLLSCNISMGDLMRAHAFKAAKQENKEGELNAGVFSYPVLMSADILAYDSDIVPVGKDQVQHVEICRAIAKRFNHHYGESLKSPEEKIQEDVAVIPGIDGQKMSKSYNNGINPLSSAKEIKKQVMSIVTDSKGLEDKKDPSTCHILQLASFFFQAQEMKDWHEKYKSGLVGYGHAKLALLERVMNYFEPAQKRYAEFQKNPQPVHEALEAGATKARELASHVLKRCRKACGLE